MSFTPSHRAIACAEEIYAMLWKAAPHPEMPTDGAIAAIIDRHFDPENKRAGYVCVGCGQHQPRDHFFYTASNPETEKTITPLCALCVRGGFPEVMGKPWRHMGPHRQT